MSQRCNVTRDFRLLTAVVVLACLFFAVADLKATDYYVSVKGSDSNSGLDQSHAFKTIQKAASVMVAGDLTFVLEGTYNERISSVRNGTSQKPIVFRSKGWVKMQGFYLRHDYIHVIGFDISGTMPPDYQAYINMTGDCTGCKADYNYIHDGKESVYGIKVDQNAKQCVVSNNVLDGVDMTVLDINGDDHLVEYNTLKNSQWDAIRFFGARNVIRHNYFTNFYYTGITHTDLFQTFGDLGFYCYDCVIEGNVAVDCDAQICMLSQEGGDVRDIVFRENWFIRIGSSANVCIPGTEWYNNTFYDVATWNDNGAILFYNASFGVAHNSTVYNNVFYGCGGSNDAKDGWYWVDSGVTGFKGDYNLVTTKDNKAKTGFSEPHGVNGGNPGFVSLADDDFHLRANSPCRNAGTNVVCSSGQCDGEGDPRLCQGIVDMGADEFHPRLYVTGDTSPGSKVKIRIVGDPGTAPVGLWLSCATLPTPTVTPNGNWYLADPYIGTNSIIPSIPASGIGTLTRILPDLGGTYHLALQALVGDSFTNPHVFMVH